LSVAEILSRIELEFRNAYWFIRSSRSTNWKSVNKTRVLAEMLYFLGVPRWAVKEARYCLKAKDCRRCAGDEDGLPCHAFRRRFERGDYGR
jgi:hypothetical protein